MRPLHAIVTAGLLMNREPDLEGIVQTHCAPRTLHVIAPAAFKMSVFKESLRSIIQRTAVEIQKIIDGLKNEFGVDVEVTLFGRSLGGTLIRHAAEELGYKNIRLTVPVEAPLHPYVPVKVSKAVPPLWLCRKHYDERPEIAQKGQADLERLGTSKLLIIKGGSPDSIVPQEAQSLPGDFRELVLGHDQPIPDLSFREATNGLILQLPPFEGENGSGPLRLLPQEHRNHLFWSDDKKDFVGRVLQSALAS